MSPTNWQGLTGTISVITLALMGVGIFLRLGKIWGGVERTEQAVADQGKIGLDHEKRILTIENRLSFDPKIVPIPDRRSGQS